MGWWEYVREVAGDDSTRKISEKMGGKVTPSGIARWKEAEVPPKAESAMEFARAYEQSLLAALLEAGLVSEEEIRKELKGVNFEENSDDALLRTLKRRLERLRELEKLIAQMQADGEGA